MKIEEELSDEVAQRIVALKQGAHMAALSSIKTGRVSELFLLFALVWGIPGYLEDIRILYSLGLTALVGAAIMKSISLVYYYYGKVLYDSHIEILREHLLSTFNNEENSADVLRTDAVRGEGSEDGEDGTDGRGD